MEILKIAAFSDGDTGGNPAGVVIGDTLPSVDIMRQTAAEVGFSETAFAAPVEPGNQDAWRVRYFSPESEVPFCGHATIALGAGLAMKYGAKETGMREFALTLNDATIPVSGQKDGNIIKAALQSPPTKSASADPQMVDEALKLLGYTRDDLDTRIPPARAHGGADHLILALKDRNLLAAMDYDLDTGRAFMNTHNIVTIALIVAETNTLFHARNAFASGGVLEDPATGAAAAAFAGYLRDINWPHKNQIDIIQGEDMGMRSLLRAEFSDEAGSSVKVSGTARIMA
ncbi:MAG: PhzF family phenazine biosynthesis protein [Robiginitomaculum sp.]|nr:PhzF family phenazine biosynthesis protein [Robiginitomaculum sp.]